MATAFTQPGKSAYHYQYSVPYASHSVDVSAYFGPATPNQSPEFTLAWRRMWGNFATLGNPSISDVVANGGAANSPNAASLFPAWTDASPQLINLNETGGTPYIFTTACGVNVTQYMEPGLRNNITSANAYTWEHGRGQRCEFWRDLSPFIPQ